jgi:prefoldin subunit 5
MKYLKRFWNWLLGKTTIDERIEAKVDEVVEEVKERVGRIKEEFSDVKEAISEVADQAGDVIDAAKGKKRRGRPKKK